MPRAVGRQSTARGFTAHCRKDTAVAFFKDLNGREWRIRLTGPVLAKVREATGITLADSAGRGALEACANGEIQTRVLWLLCEGQPPALTPEQFAESVASGDVFEAAKNAIYEAIVDFTPPSQRPALQKALETEREVTKAGQDLAIEKIGSGELRDQLIDALRTGMDANIATILTQLRNASTSPAPAASSPTA